MHTKYYKRGSALLSVIMFTAVMLVMAGSIIGYSLFNREHSERVRLNLRARTMAENISSYGAEQLSGMLRRTKSTEIRGFPSGLHSDAALPRNSLRMPPDTWLTNWYTDPSKSEMFGGITATTGWIYIDPTLASNANDPHAGLQVNRLTSPIITKTTLRHPSLGSTTVYAEQALQISLVPIFQFGMFYNMDLELMPGPNMTIGGPVHVNGSLIPRGEGNNTIEFLNRVTVVGGLYANGSRKALYRSRNGSSSVGSGGNGLVYFNDAAGNRTNINFNGFWHDHLWGNATETTTTQGFFESFADTNYDKNVRTSVHKVSTMQLPAVGVYKETNDTITPEDDRDNGRQLIDLPNATDAANSLIETKLSYQAGLYIVVNPDDIVRPTLLPNGTTQNFAPYSYRCFLNYTQGNARIFTEVVLPGQPTYGPMNTTQNVLPNRYTDITSVGHNQIVRMARGTSAPTDAYAPYRSGQPLVPAAAIPGWPVSALAAGYNLAAPFGGGILTRSTGYSTPNTPASNNNHGAPFALASTNFAQANAIYPTQHDAYFYDLRRATQNAGFAFPRSAGSPYTPRPLMKIDFDVTRFKMAVDRTVFNRVNSSPMYHVGASYDNAQFQTSMNTELVRLNWANHIYNPNSTLGTFPLTAPAIGDQLPYAIPAPAVTRILAGITVPVGTTAANTDPFRIYFATAYAGGNIAPVVTPVPANLFDNPGGDCAWYDGIAVYVHSIDAERTQANNTPNYRADSAVRLINGRGPAPTFPLPPAGATTPWSNRTGFTFVTNDALYIVGHFNADGALIIDPANVAAFGGFSGRYPDANNEPLCAIMADSITILSQPLFSGPANNAAALAATNLALTNADGYSYYTQCRGWADALSHLRPSDPNTASWSNTWRTTVPSNGNQYEGDNIGTRLGYLPTVNLNTRVAGANNPNYACKNAVTSTEISSALLMGIIPSNHNPSTLTTAISPLPSAGPGGNAQYSGGAHNFPRLLENWHMGDTWTLANVTANATGGSVDNYANLCIRGSMVACFESRVGMEPWNIRAYQAPIRLWGLHEGMRQPAHDIPLEPTVIDVARTSYREIDQSRFNTAKVLIQSLPVL